MDQATCATFAGIGATAVIARSAIAGRIFRAPIHWLLKRIWRSEESWDEWCLYCTGFWVGLAFHFAGFGWLSNPLMDGLYLCGVAWIAAEITEFFEAVWFAFAQNSEKTEDLRHGVSTAELPSEPPDSVRPSAE